jgi:hypothetical protein
MKCGEAQKLFSPYVDCVLSGKQMLAMGCHLQTCRRCDREYAQFRKMQQLVGELKRAKAPADLALKLRVAISQEAAQVRRPRFAGLAVRLENALNAFAIPATGGLVTAVVIFGLFMGFVTLPPALQANDVPLTFYTAPELQQGPLGVGSIGADSLVIETVVNEDGRVQDYRILALPDNSDDIAPQVKKMLLFTTFRPATWMGRPTRGRAVLTFSRVSVKG